MSNNLFADNSQGSHIDLTSTFFALNFHKLDASETDLFLSNWKTSYVHHGDDIIIESIITSHQADTVSQASINLNKNGTDQINKNAIVPSAVNNTEVTHVVSDTVANTILTEGDTIETAFTVGGAGDSVGLMIKLIIKRYVA